MFRTAGVLAVLFALASLIAGCGGAPEGSPVGAEGMVVDVPAEEAPADAAALVLNRVPAADTALNQAAPAANFGLQPTMGCGRMVAGAARRILLRFNLVAIPTSATVNNATLRLYVSDTAGQEVDRFSVHRVTANWTEMTATWNNMAANHSPVAVSIRTIAPSAAGTVVSWNVTGLAQNWITTPSRNLGCLVRGTEGSQELLLYISSRQNAVIAQRPRLIVDYTP